MKRVDATGKCERFEELRLLPGHSMQLDFDGYNQDRVKSLLAHFAAKLNTFRAPHCDDFMGSDSYQTLRNN